MYLQLSNLEDDTKVLFLISHKKAPNISLNFISVSCHLVKIGENGHIVESYPIASKILSPASKSNLGELEILNNKLNKEVKKLPLFFNEGFVRACEALIDVF